MKDLTYTIQDESGIHARPAGLLVKAMQGFDSSVTIRNGDKTADGKKLFQVMKLGVKQNDTITVLADGPDEDDALRSAKAILEENL